MSAATDSTKLAGWDVAYRGPLSVELAVLIGVVLAAIGVLFYYFDRAKTGVLRLVVLSVLRAAVFALLLVFLMGPVLEVQLSDERAHPVVLLVDNSQSMKQKDRRVLVEDRVRAAMAQGALPLTASPDDPAAAASLGKAYKDPSRLDVLRGVLAHPELKLGARLSKAGPVRALLFGAAVQPPRDGGGDPVQRLVEALRGDDERTALADAVHDVLQRKEADRPAAIVVMTDGLDTGSKFSLDAVAQSCRALGVPLHIYGVGTPDAGSLQLREVGAPETIFLDDTIHVPVRWRARGFNKGTLEISLHLRGESEPLDKRTLPVHPGDDLREVLSFTLKKEAFKNKKLDDLALVTSIRLKEDASVKDEITRPVRVLDSKIKVLYIEGAPRWEYQFIQAALLRDRRVEPHFLLAGADAKVLEAGLPFIPALPAKLVDGKLDPRPFNEAKYDVVIVGDVPADFLNNAQWDLIGKFVKERGGLIVVAGRRHMPAAYAKTPLADMLPVEFKPGAVPLNPEERTQEYQPKLSPVGESMDMMALADNPEENVKAWSRLPGFHWHFPVTRLRPGAIPLIVHPFAQMLDEQKSDTLPMPIMAQQYYGHGQVVFLATDETWRWRYNTQDKHYARFWGQMIYQTGLPHLLGADQQRVQMALYRSEAILGRPGKIFVRLLDENLNPRTDAKIEAVLKHLDAKGARETHKVVLLPVDKGIYQGNLDHDRPGRFEVTLRNPAATFSYRVQLPPQHELIEEGMAEPELRRAATVSGGRFYREEDLRYLPDAIAPKKTAYTWRDSIDLSLPLLVLFVLVITAEWVLRKFADLS